VKLVHRGGFITNKFITMHGHMNVKRKKEKKKERKQAALIPLKQKLHLNVA
jgi:hypothetical protein